MREILKMISFRITEHFTCTFNVLYYIKYHKYVLKCLYLFSIYDGLLFCLKETIVFLTIEKPFAFSKANRMLDRIGKKSK